MTIKIWRGDAPAVAQVVHVEASDVEIGDLFSLTINGKSVIVTATAATVANVLTLLLAAIDSTEISEFREIVASIESDILVLTASEPGVPFGVSAAANNGTGGIVVSTIQHGSPLVTATDMTQTFRIPLSAAGEFQVSFGGVYSALQAIGASAATLQTALQAMSSIGSGNCTVAKSTDTNDAIYVLTFTGSFSGTNVATVGVVLHPTKPLIRTTQEGSSSGTLRNEIQTVDVGLLHQLAGITYTLTFNAFTTAAISTQASAEDVREALISYGSLNQVNVTKSGGLYTIEFVLIDGNANQSQLVASVYSDSTFSTHYATVSTTAAGGAYGPLNEQQLVTVVSAATGGTFTLTFAGQTTSPIAYNASSATVVAALQSLSSIGTGNVSVTGSAGGPWTVEWIAAMQSLDQPAMTADGSNLTGGSAQSLSATEFVVSSGPNHWDTAANWIPAGVPANGDDVRFELGRSDCLYGLNQSAVTLASLHVFLTWTGKLGLPRQHPDGFVEYRPQELAIGATSIVIGIGEGSGSGKIAINTGAVQTAIEIHNSGGSSDVGLPAILWRGTHVGNDVTVLGGEFGTAAYSDQSAVIDTLIQRGGAVSLRHTTLDNLIATRQNISAWQCTLGGQPLEL